MVASFGGATARLGGTVLDEFFERAAPSRPTESVFGYASPADEPDGDHTE